eukprot:gb/GECH01013673.1/.p1 GENE.gb/GECH01013673.1/~~gb/GECH01013673.1/.p1  ORF type:complete len:559 (+),score=162.46 gb/GECH01013673.1/:1-1677(+)
MKFKKFFSHVSDDNESKKRPSARAVSIIKKKLNLFSNDQPQQHENKEEKQTRRASNSNKTKEEESNLPPRLKKELVIGRNDNDVYSEELLEHFFFRLCDPQELVHSYLSTSWSTSIPLWQESKKLATYQHQHESTDEIEEENDDNDESIYPTFVSQRHLRHVEKYNIGDIKSITMHSRLPLKLVLVDFILPKPQDHLHSYLSPFIRSISSPLGSDVNKCTHDDIRDKSRQRRFRVGLMFGPWLLFWDRYGLCIPRKLVSDEYVCVSDIRTIAHLPVQQTIESISKIITKWNVNMHHKHIDDSYISPVSSPRQKSIQGTDTQFMNSQNFIDEIFAVLSINKNFRGSLAGILDTIRKDGNTPLYFEMNPEFRDVFNLESPLNHRLEPRFRYSTPQQGSESLNESTFPLEKEDGQQMESDPTNLDLAADINPWEGIFEQEKDDDKVIFETHEELDRFMLALLEIDPDFNVSYPDDWALLKTVDRLFWIRHFRCRSPATRPLGMDPLKNRKLSLLAPRASIVEEDASSADVEKKMDQEIFSGTHHTECPFRNPFHLHHQKSK